MAGNPSLNRRGGLAAIIAALVLAALIPSQAAAATRPITFELILGNACLWGRASDNATVNYTWRDASGALVLSGQTTSGHLGYWVSTCAAGRSLRPGDRIRASDGNSTRKYIIPELTLVLNRVTNVIKGRAPAGTQVEIEYLFPSEPGFDVVTQTKDITVDADDQWSFRPHRDIIGGVGAFETWRSPVGHLVYIEADASMFNVTIGRAAFSGIGRVYSPATVAVRDGVTGGLKGKGVTTVDGHGNFTGILRDAAGKRVVVLAGDRVRSNVASNADFIVPDIDAVADVVTDTVSGRCYDTGRYNSHVNVFVYRNGFRRGWASFDTAPDGLFEAEMTDAFPDSAVIKHGDDVLVRCRQAHGDYVQKWFAVP